MAAENALTDDIINQYIIFMMSLFDKEQITSLDLISVFSAA